jgi:hypothetical protein
MTYCKDCRFWKPHTGLHDDMRGGWLHLGHCEPVVPFPGGKNQTISSVQKYRGLTASDYSCPIAEAAKPDAKP